MLFFYDSYFELFARLIVMRIQIKHRYFDVVMVKFWSFFRYYGPFICFHYQIICFFVLVVISSLSRNCKKNILYHKGIIVTCWKHSMIRIVIRIWRMRINWFVKIEWKTYRSRELYWECDNVNLALNSHFGQQQI